MDVSLTSDSLDQTLVQQVLYTPLLSPAAVCLDLDFDRELFPPPTSDPALSFFAGDSFSHLIPSPSPSTSIPSPSLLCPPLGQATFDLLPTSFPPPPPSTPPLTLASSPYSTVQYSLQAVCRVLQ
ncbi:hypothetical protein FALCPG4_005238 [Fusarium falciforme]